MRVLLLEPYDGGSHRRFLDELTRELDLDVLRLSRPARAWKWRMRFAAPDFAARLRALRAADRRFDLVIASTFLDLAAFRALAPAEIARRPHLLYFHENQFAYPAQREDERDLHFGVTNFQSALAAERCLFNSRHNLESFLDAAADLARRAPDMDLTSLVPDVRSRSAVLPVPLDLRAEPPCAAPRPAGPPLVLWNHRWEHDKDPEAFFRVVETVAARGLDFEVAVAGESFARRPAVFDEAPARLGARLVHHGFLPSRADYLSLLRRSALCVSTARHEFQGLAVLEAAAQGAHLLLPDRLSYPELFPDLARYRDEEDLLSRLAAFVAAPPPVDPDLVARAIDFSWERLAPRWREELEALAAS
ncbi:MAG: DUF3524 domain-containing protein [Planctomycetota bacterium]